MSKLSKKISLGYPLDLLLNRECKFDEYQEFINKDFTDIKFDSDSKKQLPGSIILPTPENPGTGNIIIRGKPGTAKSTLAMQFAVSAAQNGNDCISFYITLEERPENILFKAKPFGWDRYCSIFNQMCGLDESASVADYKIYLENAMSQDLKKSGFPGKNWELINGEKYERIDIQPHVFISTLTPRNLFVSDTMEFNLFWERYKQLERLLEAAKAYNDDCSKINKDNWTETNNTECSKDIPKIGFVVIDSINVFGNNLLSRSELFRLFDLFKKYRIIGIIIVEEDEKYIFHHDNNLHGETLEYIGDVIISLTSEEDHGYSIRYMEITKSRYQHQVYGKHPFKIMESLFSKNLQTDFYKRLTDNEKGLTSPNDFICIREKEIEVGKYKIKKENIVFKPVFEEIPNYLEKTDNHSVNDDKSQQSELFKVDVSDTNVNLSSLKSDSEELTSLRDFPGPFKILLPLKPVFAVKVFLSLHYIVYGTDNIRPNSNEPGSHQKKENTTFCDKNANLFLSQEPSKINSLLVEGPRDTFKTSLARDFLLKGLIEKETVNESDDHVLFIRFQDFCVEGDYLNAFRISEKCKEIIYKRNRNKPDKAVPNEDIKNEFINDFSFSEKDVQYSSSVKPFWEVFKRDKSLKSTKRFLNSYVFVTANGNRRYTELIYQSGYIFAEEFLQILLETIHTFKQVPKRIVLDEIGRIGSSYPLLFHNRTSGDLFLTTLFHIIRNYDIKLLVTGTTGEYSKSNEIIDKVRTLVDDVLTTKKINVFGDNYVTIQGATFMSSEAPVKERERSDENVPGVIIPTETFTFKVDNEKFIGLVGFGTDKIYRPGLGLFLFEENEHVHKKYNENIRKMLSAAYASTESLNNINKDINSSNIGLVSFGGPDSPSYHAALDIIRGNPIDKTVLFTIDEFYRSKDHNEFYASFMGIYKKEIEKLEVGGKKIFDEEYLMECSQNEEDDKIYSFPYYGNVLLLVVNKSKIKDPITEDKFYERFTKWSEILKRVNELNIKKDTIDLCLSTRETLSCILLDVLLFSSKEDYKDGEKINLKDVLEKLDRNLLKDELSSLSQLMYMSGRVKHEFLNKGTDKDSLVYKGVKKNQLISDAFIYVCWYSELRELLYRNPDLSDKLEVFQLPGKGFKGDWQIGLLNGSVSVNLGLKVIEKLCSKNEDFKRFVLGVGLPTQARFKDNNDFLAWPNSKISLNEKFRTGLKKEQLKSQLALIYAFHDKAHERAKITNYLDFKEPLVALFQELILIEGGLPKHDKTVDAKRKEDIKKIIIDRLLPIYKFMIK